MLIIGSSAIKFWFKDFNREPKDLDVILYKDENYIDSLYRKIEFLENEVLLKFCKNDFEQKHSFLNPNTLYTLKMSHMFWDINWEKHMFDIQFLKEKSCVLIESLFYDLYEHWNKTHANNKRSDLKLTSNAFFKNSINYPIEHDEIHKLLLQHPFFENDVPTYTKILKTGCEVEVCENKFNQLSFDEKCSLVYDEVLAMQLERFSDIDYRKGYSFMLKKFIINHSPIWEAIFIIENYKLLHKAPLNVIEFFNNLTNNKMELKEFNEIFLDISEIRNGRKFKKVSSSNDKRVDENEGTQGDYNTIVEIYDVNKPDCFLKMGLETNSYGYDEHITSLSFVKPVLKQVTDYEII